MLLTSEVYVNREIDAAGCRTRAVIFVVYLVQMLRQGQKLISLEPSSFN